METEVLSKYFECFHVTVTHRNFQPDRLLHICEERSRALRTVSEQLANEIFTSLA